MPASAQGSKFSVEQVAKIKDVILASLQNGASFSQSVKAAGIDYMTFWRWRQKDAEFEDAVHRIDDVRTKIIEDALYAKAVGGHPTAMIFWLCNRARQRWQSVNKFLGVESEKGGHVSKVVFEVKRDNGADTKE